jgi:hypothetical protein
VSLVEDLSFGSEESKVALALRLSQIENQLAVATTMTAIETTATHISL